MTGLIPSRLRPALAATTIAALAILAPPASGQTLGTFRWQIAPYCNVATFTVTVDGAAYRLAGFDDRCAAGPAMPAAGVVTAHSDGSFTLGFYVVTPEGLASHTTATLAPGSYSGPWKDNAGATGTLVFNPAVVSGAPRPSPTLPAFALANGSVTSSALAAGSVGATAVNSAEIQLRIQPTCVGGLFLAGASSTGVPDCSDGSSSGTDTTALGRGALAANTIGISNTALGSWALTANTSGVGNVAVGDSSLRVGNNPFNTAVGSSSLKANVGSNNTAVGALTLRDNTNGGDNSAVGAFALGALSSGSGNTAVGWQALGATLSGSGNVAVGPAAGYNVSGGSDNIHIANQGSISDTATIRIGTPLVQTRAFLAGVRGVTTGAANAIGIVIDSNGQLGTLSSSRRFKRDIADMGDLSRALLALRPVTFRYIANADDGPAKEYGLIAEEVADIFPDLVVRDADGRVETVQYHKLTPMLLNELQRQARAVDALRTRVAALETALRERTAAAESARRPE